MGGKFHLKLNIGERPIANKYREGKMQRTLKRELKVLEIVKREAIRISVWSPSTHPDRMYRQGPNEQSFVAVMWFLPGMF